MNKKEAIQLIPAGRTFRTHGIKGEIEVEADELLLGWIEKEKIVFFHVDGSAVPFWIDEIRHEARIFFRFEDISTPEAARALVHKEFFIDRSRLPSSILKKLDGRLEGPGLEGFMMEDKTSGRQALILSVEEYPSQLMAEVELDQKKIMIPLHPDLISRIDKKNKKIFVQLPEGMFDLV